MSRLIQAAKEGLLDLVKELLDAHDDVNQRDKEGRTALHAVIIGVDEYSQVKIETRIEIINRLLKAQASLTIKDRYGKMPINYVNHVDLLQVLVNAQKIKIPYCADFAASSIERGSLSDIEKRHSFFSSSSLTVVPPPVEVEDIEEFLMEFSEESEGYKEFSKTLSQQCK